ncbi:MAG: hypothetical protein WKG01_15745 [Kofleriaceae bacterium]
MSRKHLLLLAAAVTDRTFERTILDARPVWVGKCIHCNSKLVLADDGRPLGEASLEHVWPQARGGSNDVANLAVACALQPREVPARRRGGRGARSDGRDAARTAGGALARPRGSRNGGATRTGDAA